MKRRAQMRYNRSLAVRRWFSRMSWIMMVGALFTACAGAPQPSPATEEHRDASRYAREGVRLFKRGCYANALGAFQDAHERYTAADQMEGVAQSLNGIADIYYRWGDMESAVSVYNDVIEIDESLRDLPGTIQAMCNKAAALIAMDRLETAAAVLKRADSRDPKNRHAALRLRTRALLAIKERAPQRAMTLLDQALTSAGSDESLLSGIYFTMGYVDLKNDRPEQAKSYFARALELDRAAGAHHDIARDLEGLGTCSARLGDPRMALNFFKRSAKIYALLKDNRRAGELVPALEKSARLAGVDVAATLNWIEQWMLNPGGAALCD